MVYPLRSNLVVSLAIILNDVLNGVARHCLENEFIKVHVSDFVFMRIK